MEQIKTKSDATAFLNKYIPKGRVFKFPGDVGLKREAYLLKLLGEPQNKLKVIHIAGTSGKGSTSYLTSVILNSLGFNVGLCLSPTLLDIRERFQINNTLITEKDYYSYLNELVPVVESMTGSEYGLPTHFEIMVALTYYIFWKKKVDYAVIETGLGGLYDGTNVVTNPNKIAVITRIGHDHMHILGNTLSEIAFQKAGIIHPKNAVFTINQYSTALKVIKDVGDKKSADLFLVNKTNIKNLTLTPNPKFSFSFLGIRLNNVSLAMLGSFQVENCSLALAVGIYLSTRDKFIFNEEKIKTVLSRAEFKGRMQKFIINRQTIIVDGAHNPQKMGALVKNLVAYFTGQKFVFMIALKRGKDYVSILKRIVPYASKIIISPFSSQTKAQGFVATSADIQRLATIFKALNFRDYEISSSSKKALYKVFKYKNRVGVVTGSLYLLSEVYPFLSSLGRN